MGDRATLLVNRCWCATGCENGVTPSEPCNVVLGEEAIDVTTEFRGIRFSTALGSIFRRFPIGRESVESRLGGRQERMFQLHSRNWPSEPRYLASLDYLAAFRTDTVREIKTGLGATISTALYVAPSDLSSLISKYATQASRTWREFLVRAYWELWCGADGCGLHVL